MAWQSEIELGQWVETVVNYEAVRMLAYTNVYANKKSVRQSEYYNGITAGRKPEIVYEIRAFEFDDHEKVKVGSKEYDIIRTYEKGEFMELVLGSVVV